MASIDRGPGCSRTYPDWASLAGLILGFGLFAACAGRPGGAEHGETDAQVEPAPATPVARVDAAVERSWAAAELEPGPEANDEEYLRRVSLDLRGRVPTRDEVARFLAATEPDKRARLVDALLASDEFADYWAQLWAARLLPGERRAARVAEEPLETYLRTALSEGRSWTEVVTALVAGEGRLDDDPALAFLGARNLRGATKQDALAELSSTTARVFLGARIECAQCHDHPYLADFSREDFWAQTAYFGRLGVTLERGDDMDERARVEVSERVRGELRVALGGDEDPRKRPIPPRFMGAESSSNADLDTNASGASRRATLAAEIVADPRFAEATAGWVWTQLFGRGVVEPWDDLLGTDPRPELLLVLAEEFRSTDHDLRGLIRTVVLSTAYQRSSAGAGDERPQAIAEAEAGFARAAARPLSAAQLFASLLTVTELEHSDNRAFRRAVRARKDKALREYEFVFDDDGMDEMAAGAGSEGFAGNVPQALLLQNGALTNLGVGLRPGTALERIAHAPGELDDRVRELWLTVYGRAPGSAELELARGALAHGRDADWEDLMFAMLNSSEFTSNH